MLGLFLLYFIGKAYYELAKKHEKHTWGYAILGVVTYYGGTLGAGIFFAVLAEFGVSDVINELPNAALSVIVLPFGLLACWGLYRVLSQQWRNQIRMNKNESLDGDLIDHAGNRPDSN